MLIDDYELTRQVERMKDVNRDDVIALIARQKPVDAEPTWEQVKEYCRKRDLVLLTYELFAWLKATAKPRRHGHWEVWFENEETRQVKCSECRMMFTVGKGRDGNYCPNCGAKMLEVDDDETD